MDLLRASDWEREDWAAGAVPARGARLVHLAGLAVLAFTVVLALVEVGRIAVLYSARYVVIAVLATAIWLPLHVWHLRYGLRDERPPRSGATLAVIAVVQFAALALIGPAWSFVLATLATSSLIVLRPPWSLMMLAACVVAPVPAALLHPAYTLTYGSNDAYLMVSVAFRSCLQFTLVWLVACARELVASRAVLAREAAEREHARLEASMRATLEQNLVRLASEARRARAEVLEPGVSAALVALDRVLRVATAATNELRRVVAEARAAPGVDPVAELARAEARARTPVGSRPDRAWGVAVLRCRQRNGARVRPVRRAWCVWERQCRRCGDSGLGRADTGACEQLARGRARGPPKLGLRAVRAHRGDRRLDDAGPRQWLARARLYIGVAAAVAFRGRARIAVVAAVFAFAGAYDVWRTVQEAPSVAVGELSWGFIYTAALTALGVIGLYGSARLITLLGELDGAREAQVRFAVDAERRRIWGDLHDVLGQTLTAITLKADLARRMMSSAPARSLAELDEVIQLAADQAHELGVIARGERDVIFDTEIDNAIALLRAAGIEVITELEVGDLDETASELLGRSVREGTTNILRHARARRVWIRAARESGRVTLELRNDGVSGESAAGTGLRGLAERAAAEDGQAAGRALPGGQFVLAVNVPEPVAV